MNLYLDKSWTLGSVFFSLGHFFCLSQYQPKQSVIFSGVSVKMNILLYSPALLAILITQLGYDFHENDIHIKDGIQDEIR